MPRAAVTLILVVVAVAACVLSPPAAAARPNVVLVLTDDQRWDTLWAMPAVQRNLVNRGVTFTNGFVTTPLCCPSRASILTGRYARATGVYLNVPPNGGFASFRDGDTVATRLQAAGYRTAYLGKYMNGYAAGAAAYVPPGWDRWFAFASLGYYRYGLNVDGRVQPARRRATYSTDLLTAEAESFIRSTRRPFFLVYAPVAPHGPAHPAKRHADLFSNLEPWRPPSYDEEDVSDKPYWVTQKGRLSPAQGGEIDHFRLDQLRTLRAVDEGVARIVRALRETRSLRNTMIVFVSDNGFAWGEHRRFGKRVPYEESIRVPFVVRYDRLVHRAREDDRLVLNVDLAPTFARLAGTRMPRADGSSFVPLLANPASPWRKAFSFEYLFDPELRLPTYCGVRAAGRWYVVYKSGEDELYDLAADPYQLDNRADDPAFADLRTRLRRTLGRLCDPTPPGFPRRLLCVEGTDGNDVLAGTRHLDVVCAGGGDDDVDGRGGPDEILLGSGNDRGRGGDGDDRLTGGDGRDAIAAGSGNDVVLVRDGERDVVDCGPGLDRVVADRGDRVARSCERVSRR